MTDFKANEAAMEDETFFAMDGHKKKYSNKKKYKKRGVNSNNCGYTRGDGAFAGNSSWEGS